MLVSTEPSGTGLRPVPGCPQDGPGADGQVPLSSSTLLGQESWTEQERRENSQSSPDWAPYRNNYDCYFKKLFNNVKVMTARDYNTATSAFLGVFSFLPPLSYQLWYIWIFPSLCYQLSFSKGSRASWELLCTRGEDEGLKYRAKLLVPLLVPTWNVSVQQQHPRLNLVQ